MSGQARVDDGADDNKAVVCPVDRAIRAIGGKWKMLVLRSLFVVGAQRYNSFLRTVPGISAKELTRNLRELERAGLVTRTRSASDKSDVEIYALTELGAALQPAFRALGAFGERLIATRAPDGERP